MDQDLGNASKKGAMPNLLNLGAFLGCELGKWLLKSLQLSLHLGNSPQLAPLD